MIDTTIKEMQEKARQIVFALWPVDSEITSEMLDEIDTLIASSVLAGYEARDREVREIVEKTKRDCPHDSSSHCWEDECHIHDEDGWNAALTDLLTHLTTK